MEITDIRIRRVNSDNKMKAAVSVTFDDSIVIHDIKIIEGREAPFIAMPSRRMPNGEFRDIAHPINSETRKALEEAIFKKYNETLQELKLEESNKDEELQGGCMLDAQIEKLKKEQAEEAADDNEKTYGEAVEDVEGDQFSHEKVNEALEDGEQTEEELEQVEDQ